MLMKCTLLSTTKLLINSCSVLIWNGLDSYRYNCYRSCLSGNTDSTLEVYQRVSWYHILSLVLWIFFMECEQEKICLLSNIKYCKKNHRYCIIWKKIKISYVPHVLSAIVKATKMYRENIIKINSMKTILWIFLKYQMITSVCYSMNMSLQVN